MPLLNNINATTFIAQNNKQQQISNNNNNNKPYTEKCDQDNAVHFTRNNGPVYAEYVYIFVEHARTCKPW